MPPSFHIKNSRLHYISMGKIKFSTVLDELYPNNTWQDIPYQETSKAVWNWCVANNAYYYSDDRDPFIYLSKRPTQEGNNSEVVVEDPELKGYLYDL